MESNSNSKRKKPFKVTREQIEDYTFTKKQISAYNALIKAAERCEKAGLSLHGKQWRLMAFPEKFYFSDMMTQEPREMNRNRIEVPCLDGVQLSDCGADDTEYIKDEFIKG